MKKILIIISVLFLTGCTTTLSSTLTIDNIISKITNEEEISPNTSGIGFKYYKPRDFSVLEDNRFNQVLINNTYRYYLNIDINSYIGKRTVDYQIDNSLYYSTKFNYNGKNGYLEIRNGFNGYFYLKMMYNYSYIEVSVKENDIKEAVVNSAIILTSIKYNDKVINNLLDSADLDDKETTFEVKKPENNNDSNVLDVYGK